MPKAWPIEKHFEKWTIPVTESGCLLWFGYRNKKGYGQVAVGNKKFYTHRLAWMLKFGEIPKDKCLCHKCDVSSCCNTDHLFLGTLAENNADMLRKGRCGKPNPRRGADNPRAKLTTEEILKIREDKRILKEIAKSYGVHFSLIHAIKTRRAWKHVE